jgi:hypothetical protein
LRDEREMSTDKPGDTFDIVEVGLGQPVGAVTGMGDRVGAETRRDILELPVRGVVRVHLDRPTAARGDTVHDIPTCRRTPRGCGRARETVFLRLFVLGYTFRGTGGQHAVRP